MIPVSASCVVFGSWLPPCGYLWFPDYGVFIFRLPSDAGRTRISEAPIGSGALNERFKTNQVDMDVKLGHTMHGLKCECLQFERVELGDEILSDTVADRHKQVMKSLR